MDEHHGKSGTYILRDGKRVLKEDSVTKPHKDGDAPRNDKGERTDLPDPNAKPEPALPEPKAIDYGAPAGDAKPARTRARSED